MLSAGMFLTSLLAIAIEQVSLEKLAKAVVIRRKLGGEMVSTYFATNLARVRQERGGRVMLVAMEEEEVYWFAASGAKEMQHATFAEFRAADELMRNYTRKIANTVSQEFSEPFMAWRFANQPQLLEAALKRTKLRCLPPSQAISLVSDFARGKIMCVIRDKRVKGLGFLKRFYSSLPSDIRLELEEDWEIFLYSHGVVPLHGNRRGQAFKLKEVKTQRRPRHFFYPPEGVPKKSMGTAYATTYWQATQPK